MSTCLLSICQSRLICIKKLVRRTDKADTHTHTLGGLSKLLIELTEEKEKTKSSSNALYKLNSANPWERVVSNTLPAGFQQILWVGVGIITPTIYVPQRPTYFDCSGNLFLKQTLKLLWIQVRTIELSLFWSSTTNDTETGNKFVFRIREWAYPGCTTTVLTRHIDPLNY